MGLVLDLVRHRTLKLLLPECLGFFKSLSLVSLSGFSELLKIPLLFLFLARVFPVH